MATMYYDTFTKEKPRTGLDIMANRLRRNKQMDEELADLFHERAQIEENYSRQLEKLSKKQSMTEKGLFSKLDSLWEIIQLETETLSASHSQLAQNLIKAVERPVREATNVQLESSQLRQVESNAHRYLKEYEEKSNKIAKLQKVVEKNKSKRNDSNAQRVVELSKSLDEARVSLEAEMKRFYEQNEWVDVSRLEAIKKALNHYNTLQSETMVQNSQTIERSLSSIQQFVASDQISEFCSAYKDLNLSSSSLSTSSKLVGKLDGGGFGSWILRPRKNSAFTISQASGGSEPSIREARAGSMISFGSVETGRHSVALDDASVPPTESIPSEMERDSDDFSDTSSFVPQQKVKFDIMEEAIKDKPEEIALAFSNVTSSLRGLPKQKNSRERRASEIKRSLTLQEKNGNAESSGALPVFEAWTVERVDAIVSADGSCKAQISGELRVFLADPHDHFGILNSFIALLQTKAIHFVPNSQFVTEGDLGVTLNKENLMAAKGHEIVLLVYHIQALAPSAHHPLLPLNVDIAFGANPARAALNFVSRDRIKPTLVNFLKLGANFTQPGVLLSRPTPSWDQTTNEAIWDLDLNPVTPIVCQFDGASEMLLSLSFDLHLETSILEVAWPSVPFKHTAHSGVFLLTSRTL